MTDCCGGSCGVSIDDALTIDTPAPLGRRTLDTNIFLKADVLLRSPETGGTFRPLEEAIKVNSRTAAQIVSDIYNEAHPVITPDMGIELGEEYMVIFYRAKMIPGPNDTASYEDEINHAELLKVGLTLGLVTQ